MKRPSIPPTLSELRAASSPTGQVKALKRLKNELIGHHQKKEQWVKCGLLTTLAHILCSFHGLAKNKLSEDGGLEEYFENGNEHHTEEEEEVRLQAVIVIGSLAYGGSAFVSPIYAAGLILPLLSILSESDSHQQTVFYALKCLDTVASSISLSIPEQEQNKKSLTALLYSANNLSNVAQIIQQTSSAPLVKQQQIVLATALISKTCQTDVHQALAAQAGLLEALAMTAAPLILDSLSYPYHAKTNTPLASILDAAKSVVGNSRLRGIQFLRGIGQGFDRGFPEPDPNLISGPDEPMSNMSESKASPTHQDFSKQTNTLLPQIPSMKDRSPSKLSKSFPLANAVGGYPTKQIQSMSTAIEINQRQGLEQVSEAESPLIPLLLHLFRSSDDTVGLAAVKLLITFHRLGLTKKPKEPIFAMLLVPSLVRMLNAEFKTTSVSSTGSMNSSLRSIKEEASEILAILTNSCLETQSAAFTAGAIKKLSRLLKESFDPLPPETSEPAWNEESTYSPQPQIRDDAHRLGPPGICPATYHTLRLREAVLTALAAIASEKDEYRKAVIDNGVVPFVIKSLKAEPVEVNCAQSEKPMDESTTTASPQLTVNHRYVILAACGTARALSRSVSTLRTSLMDAGLPTPLFSLLKFKDLDIQIAATGVLCNLVLKFSPMREAIMEGGALKALCEQAHSMNAKLRLNSMWALKNIIAGASNPMKKTCLEELGPGWLKQTVAHDAEDAVSTANSRFEDRDDDSSTLMRMSTPNAAGEQVDLLNAVEEDSLEHIQNLVELGQQDLDLEILENIGDISKADVERKYRALDLQAYARKTSTRLPNLETGSRSNVHRALSEEVAIQKEGLEFIRNLICGDQSPDMIDHLFGELGQDKVFDILTSKLRPRILNAFSRDRKSIDTGPRQVQPHVEILTSTCYIIVHIACGHPKHRQMLVSQTELLKLLLPLFNHVSREIRTCLCWIVINVTWVEDNTDEQNAKSRARDLQTLGFIEKLDGLEKDEVLDCRERAKNARDQMRRLLGV